MDTIKQKSFELQIYDPEMDKTYLFDLCEEDYNRALSDYAYSESLLISAQKEIQSPKEPTGDVPIPEEHNLPSTSFGSGTRWNREAILNLIVLYKENQHKFKSTTIKNEHVWKLMADTMQKQGFHFNKIQLENRFKYLKARYIKKKENKGSKGTGESPVFFEYYDEFNEMFGDHPNIEPKVLASSLNIAEKSCSSDESGEPTKKKTRLDKEISLLTKLFESNEEKKEDEKERRHQERQELTKKALSVYETLMQKLIDKL